MESQWQKNERRNREAMRRGAGLPPAGPERDAGEPERWLCAACGQRGEGRGQWDGTSKCPRCGKRKVTSNRCSVGSLCCLAGLPGSRRHSTVEDARHCEARWNR